MKTFLKIIIVLCLHLMFVNQTLAQVTARYTKVDKTEIEIENKTGNTIYIFGREKAINGEIDRNIANTSIQIPSNIDDIKFFKCLKQDYLSINTGIFQYFINPCNNSEFFYYIKNGKKIVEGKSVTIVLFKEDAKQQPQVPIQPDTVKSEPQSTPVNPTTTVVSNQAQDNQATNKPVEKVKSTEASSSKAKTNTNKNLPDILKIYQKEYQGLYDEYVHLLANNGKKKEYEIEELKEKQKDLNVLKKQVEDVNIKDTEKERKEIKRELINKINNLNYEISKYILGETYKQIEENYKENIFQRDSILILELETKATALAVAISKKERKSDFTKWIGRDSLQLQANNLKREIEREDSSFNLTHTQFIEKWTKEINEKAVLEGLVGGFKDKITEGFTELKYTTSNYNKRIADLKFPYILFIAVGIALLAIIIALILYIRARLRKRKIEEDEQKSIEDVIRPVDEDDTEINVPVYSTALDNIEENAWKDYYIVDMQTIFDDTAIQTVYINRQCILDIYKFFSGFLKSTEKINETGCFVIGRWGFASDSDQGVYNITLEKIIEPGKDAVYGEYALDFGTEIGIGLESAIITLRQKTGKEYLQTSWIHTHPGLGLFLSKHDLIVQSQLAYSEHPNRMLAIVIDSNTENLSMAFFTPKKDGNMNNKDELKKELSLEEVYQWTKKMPVTSVENTQIDYYFYISNTPDACIAKILLSGTAIIDMDSAIMQNPENVVGYFCGNKNNSIQNQAVIEEFKIPQEIEKSECPILGCLLAIPEFSYPAILEKYEPIINRYDFFAVYQFGNDEFRFIIKDTSGKFPDNDKDIHAISLMEMKKWTRRKRI